MSLCVWFYNIVFRFVSLLCVVSTPLLSDDFQGKQTSDACPSSQYDITCRLVVCQRHVLQAEVLDAWKTVTNYVSNQLSSSFSQFIYHSFGNLFQFVSPTCFSYTVSFVCFLLWLLFFVGFFFFLQRVRGLRTGRGWLLYLT